MIELYLLAWLLQLPSYEHLIQHEVSLHQSIVLKASIVAAIKCRMACWQHSPARGSQNRKL